MQPQQVHLCTHSITMDFALEALTIKAIKLSFLILKTIFNLENGRPNLLSAFNTFQIHSAKITVFFLRSIGKTTYGLALIKQSIITMGKSNYSSMNLITI